MDSGCLFVVNNCNGMDGDQDSERSIFDGGNIRRIFLPGSGGYSAGLKEMTFSPPKPESSINGGNINFQVGNVSTNIPTMKKLIAAISCALIFAGCTSVLLLVVFFQQKKIREQDQEISSLKSASTKTKTPVAASNQSLEGPLRNAIKSGDLNQLRLILDDHPELLNAPVAGLGGT